MAVPLADQLVTMMTAHAADLTVQRNANGCHALSKLAEGDAAQKQAVDRGCRRCISRGGGDDSAHS